MSEIRYVCLSDLHFGAENSLLTHIEFGTDGEGNRTVTVDPTQPSKTLRLFTDCLADLIGSDVPQGSRPHLVLNGDILELALAEDQVAGMAFEHFVELTMKERALFDKIYFVPGNHDHHLWETAREKQYATYLLTPEAAVPKAPWHTTYVRPEGNDPVKSEQLSALLQRCGVDIPLEVRYPNVAIYQDDRVVAFHHGHFIESMYVLMSRLEKLVFPSTKTGLDVWDWEAENFAWIDFFWSTLGRSGAVGADVGLIYAMLQDRDARGDLAAQVIASALVLLKVPRPIRFLPRWILTWYARRRLKNIKLERLQGGPIPLTENARTGLTTYLKGPLARQLAAENNDTMPKLMTFVFGHTHKPYQKLGDDADYISVYNTGGWVVDSLDVKTSHGAAVVLVDEQLRVASLTMYKQHEDQTPHPVEVQPAGDAYSAPFVRWLQEKVTASDNPWAAFAQEVAEAVPRRSDALTLVIADGVRRLHAKPSAGP